METPLITLHSDTLHYMDVVLSNPHHVSIPSGVTVIIGANGSGKTTLGKIIEKGWNIRTNRISAVRDRMSIKSIEFSDIHSLAGFSVSYYQQRFEAMMNDDVPTVAALMGDRAGSARWKQLCNRLDLRDVDNKKVNYLSSGELRKLLLVNLLFELPDLLIIDNPYIGLDSASRLLLDETVGHIASQGVSVIMLLCNPADIPAFTDTVIPMHGRSIGIPQYRSGSVEELRQSVGCLFDYAVDIDSLPRPGVPQDNDFDVAFSLNGCNVRYGDREILRDVSWTVRAGECWALAGPNGSGKSTLLSLVHADNPQGYSNDIVLFDRRRGTGESIWDIKRRIGYISPEMHLYFNGLGSVLSIIAQGLNDTVGDYVMLRDSQIAKAKEWMEALHIGHLAERRFNTLSSGEQRLVLLARTFIRHPRLLILDEPLHGLDAARKRSVRAIINGLVARERITLIYVTHYLPEVPDCVTRTKTLHRISY
ncbi:MAG: ATP-binding cassette domain-containing protein [Muribaculaceae bacterium]|nr:ATP-binding cassette domain-containing protein [Muribaculaceae bacterium]